MKKSSTEKVTILTKTDGDKLSKVIEYPTGNRVEIPINKDGSVKFFDDNNLKKKTGEQDNAEK